MKATTTNSAEVKPKAGNLDLRKVRFVVGQRGDSTLIVHNFSEKSKREMADKQQGLTKAKKRDPKDPIGEYNGARYLNADGQDCFPASSVKNALVAASRYSDDKMTFLRGAMFVCGSLLPIEHTPPGGGTDPVMREDPVTVGMSKDLRYRPEYHDWKLTFDVEHNANVITAERIKQYVELAGFSIGIGEWRPERDGDRGRWEIVSMTEL